MFQIVTGKNRTLLNSPVDEEALNFIGKETVLYFTILTVNEFVDTNELASILKLFIWDQFISKLVSDQVLLESIQLKKVSPFSQVSSPDSFPFSEAGSLDEHDDVPSVKAFQIQQKGRFVKPTANANMINLWFITKKLTAFNSSEAQPGFKLISNFSKTFSQTISVYADKGDYSLLKPAGVSDPLFELRLSFESFNKNTTSRYIPVIGLAPSGFIKNAKKSSTPINNMINKNQNESGQTGSVDAIIP